MYGRACCWDVTTRSALMAASRCRIRAHDFNPKVSTGRRVSSRTGPRAGLTRGEDSRCATRSSTSCTPVPSAPKGHSTERSPPASISLIWASTRSRSCPSRNSPAGVAGATTASTCSRRTARTADRTDCVASSRRVTTRYRGDPRRRLQPCRSGRRLPCLVRAVFHQSLRDALGQRIQLRRRALRRGPSLRPRQRRRCGYASTVSTGCGSMRCTRSSTHRRCISSRRSQHTWTSLRTTSVVSSGSSRRATAMTRDLCGIETMAGTA